MIAVLCGLTEEASVITERDNVTVITALNGIVNLDELIPADCEAVVSFGTAGSLSKDVPVGTVVLLNGVFTENGTCWSNMEWNGRIMATYPAAVLAAGYSGPIEIAATPQQKAVLAARFPVKTVDMIAYAVAQFAARRKLPFVSIQGISDAFDQNIPKAAVFDATNPDGSPNIGPLVSDVEANPNDIGGLIKVAESFESAIKGLEEVYAAIQPWLAWT